MFKKHHNKTILTNTKQKIYTPTEIEKLEKNCLKRNIVFDSANLLCIFGK